MIGENDREKVSWPTCKACHTTHDSDETHIRSTNIHETRLNRKEWCTWCVSVWIKMFSINALLKPRRSALCKNIHHAQESCLFHSEYWGGGGLFVYVWHETDSSLGFWIIILQLGIGGCGRVLGTISHVCSPVIPPSMHKSNNHSLLRSQIIPQKDFPLLILIWLSIY